MITSDRSRFIAFLRIVDASIPNVVYVCAPELLDIEINDFVGLPVTSETVDRDVVMGTVLAGPDTISRAEWLSTSIKALTMVVRKDWTSPLLKLLLFCTRWTEAYARLVAAELDEADVQLTPIARAWLDTLNRKTIALN